MKNILVLFALAMVFGLAFAAGTVTCTDNDASNIYYKGTVTLTYNGSTKTIAQDSCFDSATVIEKTCNASKMVSTNKPCPTELVCLDGACKSVKATKPGRFIGIPFLDSIIEFLYGLLGFNG